MVLETAYDQNPRPVGGDVQKIAEAAGLTPKQTRIWFQNKRQRVKDQQREENSEYLRLENSVVLYSITMLRCKNQRREAENLALAEEINDLQTRMDDAGHTLANLNSVPEEAQAEFLKVYAAAAGPVRPPAPGAAADPPGVEAAREPALAQLPGGATPSFALSAGFPAATAPPPGGGPAVDLQQLQLLRQANQPSALYLPGPPGAGVPLATRDPAAPQLPVPPSLLQPYAPDAGALPLAGLPGAFHLGQLPAGTFPTQADPAYQAICQAVEEAQRGSAAGPGGGGGGMHPVPEIRGPLPGLFRDRDV